MNRLVAEVPATVANCGPGFDAIGVAVDLVTRIEASLEGDTVVVEAEGPWAGALSDAPTDGTNLLARAFMTAAGDEAPAGVRFSQTVEAPVGRGLGSSASAIVGGIVLAQGFGYNSVLDALAHAIEVEGHPDNVAPCLLGGIVVSAGGSTIRLEPPRGWMLLLAVSPTAGSTAVARATLPDAYPRDVAVRQAARASLLGAALATGDLEATYEATEDLFHQPYRLAAQPESASVMGRWRERGLPAFLAGAGPSVAAFMEASEAERCVEEATAEAPEGWQIVAADLRPEGARLIR